jgi:hypothetical protein
MLIKIFYSHRHFLYSRCAFVSPTLLLIMIPVIRIDSRADFFRSTGISRSANLSHLKPFFIAFGKRPAGATFNVDSNGELLKYFYKFANSSDRIYVAPFRRFFY